MLAPHMPETFNAAKRQVVDGFEKSYLKAALRIHAGNVTKAARHAGIMRQAFQRLMRKHGVRSADFRPSNKCRRVKVKRTGCHGDRWTCLGCGNTDFADGFEPCGTDGRLREPTYNWDGHYRCNRCHGVIDPQDKGRGER